MKDFPVHFIIQILSRRDTAFEIWSTIPDIPLTMRKVYSNGNYTNGILGEDNPTYTITCQVIAGLVTLLSISGIIVNIINIIACRKFKSKRTAVLMVIEYLAWCDLLFCFLAHPMLIRAAVSGHWVSHYIGMAAYGFLVTFCKLNTLYTLAVLAIERYVTCALLYFKCAQYMSSGIIFSFLASFIWAFLPLMDFGSYSLEGINITSSTMNPSYGGITSLAYYCLLFAFGIVLPIFVIISSYAAMTYKIYVRPEIEGLSRSRVIRAELRLSKSVFCMISAFCLVTLPYVTSSIMLTSGPLSYVHRLIHTALAVLAMSSPLIDPVVFITVDRKFKKQLRQLLHDTRLLRCIRRRKRAVIHSTVSTVGADMQVGTYEMREISGTGTPANGTGTPATTGSDETQPQAQSADPTLSGIHLGFQDGR